jgi:hypothetical protein
MPYSGRFQHGLGGSNKAMGGAAFNMGIEAQGGDTDMVTVFDDFNDVVPNDEFGAATGDADTSPLGDAGWVLTDVGSPVSETVGINDPVDVSQGFESSLRIFTGTADDAGGNMQLDLINADLASAANHLTSLSSRRSFPHLWIPENTTATILDNTVWTFACRVGMESGAADGLWAAKYYIGWAEAGDTGVLTAAGGAITQAETGPLVGFHCGEDGSIDGIAQRTVNTAYAEGTNFTELYAAGATDGTTANGATTAGDIMWFDLGLRMTITDMSDDTANGAVEFFTRRVLPHTGIVGQRSHPPTGLNPPWVRHPTALLNQTPNNDVALVPTIEVINSDDAGEDATFLLDWWAFGTSRYSLLPRA